MRPWGQGTGPFELGALIKSDLATEAALWPVWFLRLRKQERLSATASHPHIWLESAFGKALQGKCQSIPNRESAGRGAGRRGHAPPTRGHHARVEGRTSRVPAG